MYKSLLEKTMVHVGIGSLYHLVEETFIILLFRCAVVQFLNRIDHSNWFNYMYTYTSINGSCLLFSKYQNESSFLSWYHYKPVCGELILYLLSEHTWL